MNHFRNNRSTRLFGLVFGMAVIFMLMGFSSLYASEVLVYTALEDDELAIYMKDWEAKHPDIKAKIVRDST